MAIQIVEAVQQKLQLPELVKVTPEKGVTPQTSLPTPAQYQAVLVTAAAALYKISRTNEGVVRLLLSGKNESWLYQPEALGTSMPEIVSALSEYGHADAAETEAALKRFGDTLLLVLHETLQKDIGPESVKEFMSGQRHNILIYVPADLKLGKMLNDPSWDDQTNHMEGPISNMVHKIENLMS